MVYARLMLASDGRVEPLARGICPATSCHRQDHCSDTAAISDLIHHQTIVSLESRS